ncbi:MAG TPA: hypothetical protein VIV27_01415 [Halioglobus sp.]
MAIDLTGGMAISREYVFPQCPETPGMRDAVNMWVSDDQGVVGLPRFAVEALAPNWDTHDLSVNIAYPDGRVLSVRASGAAHDTKGPNGVPTVFGAGPLQFRCIEPFRRWEVTYKGPAAEMTTQGQMDGALPGKGQLTHVEFHIETTMAVPPWIQGTMSLEAANLLDSGVEGELMGGARFEQLFRAVGTLRVGSDVHEFTGSGLRIRRQGIRNIQEFWGHCWQSALFPSGRAFGYNAYPPRADGKPTYNEGYIFEGDGELIPARVVKAPWLTTLCPRGDDVSLVLETARGNIAIEGETFVSTFAMGRPELPPDFPVLQQTGVRYRWDGEETYGMMERSSRKDKITR